MEGCRVGAERPRGVGVADNGGHVGQVLEHYVVPEELLGDVHAFAVDEDVRPAGELELQPRGGDDDVCIKRPP